MNRVDTWMLFSCVIAVCCVFGQMIAGWRGRREVASRLQGGAAAAYAFLGLLNAMQRDWAAMAIQLALAATWFWIWRQGRRGKRRKSLRQLGHKARARLEAMVRNMPRPSPRLAPQRSPA